MKLIKKTWAKTLCLAICGMGVLFTAHADFTWLGTTSTDWRVAGNWQSSSSPLTNQINAGTRFNINNASHSPCVYDVYCGTTVFSNGSRGIVVGSGGLGSGTLSINGGTLITSSSGNDVVGNSAPNIGTLNINGGTFISATPGINFSLGSGSVGIVNNNGGSATFRSLILGFTAAANFNGGTTAFTNEVNGNNGLCTNNFNGGTVQALANNTAFIPNLSQANVRNGGAVFDSAGFNITVVAPLAHSSISTDSVTDGGLTKLSNGTLTLSGVPTYTGPTVVKGGRLVTPLPLSSSALVLASGSRFSPSLAASGWSMSSAAMTNATMDFNYGNWGLNGNTAANLIIPNLAISGSITCNITGTAFPITNLTLLSYGSKTGGGSFVLGALPSGAVATLNDDGANVTLNITTASIANLVWSGGDGIWQTNGGFNWNSGTAQYTEYASGIGDVVSFDDSGPGGTVTIGSQVKPGSTTVNISGSFYTFSGSGAIGGTNGIAMLGTSTLTILNTNNFTGPVTISGGSGTAGGTLFVGSPKALGATNGSVTVNGPANTLEIGIPSGSAVVVSNKTVVINGTGVGGARGALRGAAVASGTNIWAGPVVIGTDGSRIGTEDNGNLTISGPITDSGANLGLLLRPGISGVVTVSGSGSSYGYTRTYGDPTTSFIKLGANNALSTNSLQLGLGQLDLNGFNQTFGGISDNSGPGAIINNGAGASTLTISTGTNSLSSFNTGGTIADGSSVLNVVKTGSGTQTFSGPNVTYSGTTTISGGTLNLTSANPLNTAIIVAAGGTLSGEGTTTNSLTLNANSTLAFDPSTPGAFTANTVNATASPIKLLLLASAPTNTASLVLNAPNGITGSAANFQVVGSRGGIFYLTNGNTQLMFVPSSVNASLVWKGNNALHPNYWDTLTTTNWSNGGTPDEFYTADNVTFDDKASTFNVAIQGASVLPTSVTVNSATNYTITGVIGGSTTLTKGGTGTLLLPNANSYTGLTLITNGILNVQVSGALGSTASGTVVSGNGTLDVGTPPLLANTINLGSRVLTISGNGFGGQGAIVNDDASLTPQQNAVQQVVLAGNSSFGGLSRWDMRGTGNALDMQSTNTLTKVGGNQVSLVGTLINNPSNIVVNAGILSVELGANLNGDYSNTLTVNNGATLGFWAFSGAAPWTLVLNGGSTVLGEAGSSSANRWPGPVTVNGTTTLNANAGYLNFDGVITGTGSIVVNGSLGVSLTASNAYSGNTTINGGTLGLDWPSLASGSTITIASNAVLNLNFTDTNTVAALVLNGVSQPAGIYDATSGAPYITGSGALNVVPSAAPTLTFTSSGSSLQITFTGGTLQAQTNSLGSGLGTNWVDYSGSSPMTIPINPANGSVFFRVKQ